MAHIGTLISWLFKPITVPLVWLFKHRHKLDADGCCLGTYCSYGKHKEDGWGKCNDAWVKRKPMPRFGYPAPGPRTEGYSKDLSANQINAMLQEAYRRTERFPKSTPATRIDKLLDAVANNPVPIYIDQTASPHHATLAQNLVARGLTVLHPREINAR